MPHRRLATRRFLATVLFTDIVGSTERPTELGGRGWRDLLERHDGVVRLELKAFGRREMDTAGDRFVEVFEAPKNAVLAAMSIVATVTPFGLEVSARLAASARPGEVLVSDGVGT